jgi:hypothetical protein
MEEVIRGSEASWFKQLRTLTSRSFTNMSRDLNYYWLRIIIYIVMAFCLGTLYYDVGTSYTAIQARASCGGFVSGFMTFMSIGGFPSFIEEMKVFTLERQNGYYGVAVYIISNFLSSMPFLLTVSWASASITYWMVKFRPGFSYFAFFALNLYGGVSVIESLMMIISALVPNFLMGLILGAGVIVSHSLLSTCPASLIPLHFARPDLPWFSGDHDVDVRILPAASGTSKDLLAVPCILHCLRLMGIKGIESIFFISVYKSTLAESINATQKFGY